MTGPRGRRPGDPTATRAAILAAAREAFARDGFEKTSVRGVARAAGVDEGLVRHHFGDKTRLLVAAIDLQLDPREIVERVTAAGTDGLGPRLVATALALYRSPLGRAAQAAILRDPSSATLLATLLADTVGRRAEGLMPDASPEERRERFAVVQTVMVGLATSRLIIRRGPAMDMPDDRVVEVLGPVVQAAIDGRLTRPPGDHPAPSPTS